MARTVMNLIRKTARWSALIVAVLAPAVSGCQAAWAWGPLLAIVFALSSILLLAGFFDANGRSGLAVRGPLAWLVAFGLFTLLWASGMCLYDHYAGVEGGRLPALSFRGLIFAWSFAAAFTIGLEWGKTDRRLRWVYRLALMACTAYAGLNVLQWCGIGPTEVLGWKMTPGRPSGMYTNSNRFAVLLSMGWSCGVALFAAGWALPTRRVSVRSLRIRVLFLGLIFIAIAVVSAGIVFTLSRLTIVATSLGLGFFVLAWLARGHRRAAWQTATDERDEETDRRRIVRRLLPVGLIVASSILFLGVGLTLAGRSLGSRMQRLRDPSGWERLTVMRVGVDLVLESPVLGSGLGSFETVFRPRQPIHLQPRYVEVHNDYLQVGIDLGCVGLVGVVGCTVAFGVLWWRGLRRRRRKTRLLLRMAGGVGIFVPLICSLGDFPLREPSNAILFFLLAGALAASLQRGVSFHRGVSVESPKSGFGSGVLLWAGSVVMLPLFIWLAVCAVRIGVAASLSPWLGLVVPPEPNAEHVGSYREALKWSPRDPVLVPLQAASAVKALRSPDPKKSEELRVEAAAAISALRQLNPRDYRAYWLEAAVQAQGGNQERVMEALEKAVALAPAYRLLRLQAAQTRLVEGVARAELFSEERDAHLDRLLEHMRMLLRMYPGREGRFLEALRSADVMPEERAKLWPGGEPADRLRRAQLWIGQERWDVAERELAGVSARGADLLWLDALNGRVHLERLEFEAGLAAWRRVLLALRPTERRILKWMRSQINERLPIEAALPLAEKLAADLSRHPSLCLTLARRLIREKKLEEADRLLAVSVDRRPTRDAFRCWAELAVRMGDPEAALSHARQAFQLSDRSPQWSRWFDSIEKRAKRDLESE